MTYVGILLKAELSGVITTGQMEEMKDIQSQPDYRNIDLTKVGIKGIKYPMNVLDRTNKTQATVATVNMYVHLPHRFKGTHMSRFVEVLDDYCADLNLKTFFEMLDRIKKSLEAPAANLEIRFPYFIKKKAPVSGVPSMMEYTCTYVGEIKEEERKLHIGVRVPVCTLCPCSKEISSHGAHNQRGIVSVTAL
ncbi:MAG: GTP cyclohydrolase, FolE2/MptA family, partial [Thermodesulfobacteriota bacterium]|nr:GTP cyclohydrolase, FolE2/MptA family [Thermodesulfobacteriota bacterium]